MPPTIGKEIYERLLANKSESEKALLAKYFQLDTNAIPEVYALRRDVNFNYTSDEIVTLLAVIDSILFEEDLSDDLLVGRSISEWEIKSMFNVEHNKARLYWLHRSLERGAGTGGPAENTYFEPRGDVKHTDRLTALHGYMGRRFEPSTVSHFKTFSVDACNNNNNDAENDNNNNNNSSSNDVYNTYLNDYRHDVNELLHKSLSQIILKRSEWTFTGQGLGLPGNELTEMLLHSSIAFDCTRKFIGREELVRTIVDKVVNATGCVVFF